MAYTTLLTTLNDGILEVTINRPDKLNALNAAVFTDLEVLLQEVSQDASIRSVIITGAGEKAFVAGADISEFKGLSAGEARNLATRGQQVFARIEQSTKPFIAAVNGFALGGGCELAMACHMRFATEQAKFGQPEVNLGLIPGYGGTQRLVQLAGKGKALELLLSGNMMDAQNALQCGLVNAVTPASELMDTCRKMLRTIQSKAPLAVAACITAANAVYDESKNGYEVELDGFAAAFDTEDMVEGTTAFMEKRKPVFTGK